MTPEQEARYALDYGVDRADLKPAVRAEYDRLQAAGYGQSRPAPAPQPAKASPRVAKPLSYLPVLGWGAAALVLFIVHFTLPGLTVASQDGLSMSASEANNLCNSGLGTIGQASSSSIAAKCSEAGALCDFGSLAGWFGLLVLVGGCVAAYRLWQRTQKQPA